MGYEFIGGWRFGYVMLHGVVVIVGKEDLFEVEMLQLTTFFCFLS